MKTTFLVKLATLALPAVMVLSGCSLAGRDDRGNGYYDGYYDRPVRYGNVYGPQVNPRNRVIVRDRGYPSARILRPSPAVVVRPDGRRVYVRD